MKRSPLGSALLLSAAVALLAGAGCGDGLYNPSLLDFAAPCDGDPGSCGGGCSSDVQCTVANPRCDKNSGRCVPCLPLNDSCPPGSRCVPQNGGFACASACQTPADCPRSDAGASKECCNAACIDTTGDRANCGGCGKACAALPNTDGACVSGVCGVGVCNAGFADCNQIVSDGCEAAITTDGKNCGACGNVCPPVKNGSGSCTAGKCTSMCSAGFLHCSMVPADGCEVNGTNDPKNCGACGNACPVGANGQVACVAGKCALVSCAAGFADCDQDARNGCEVSTATDRNNCGACGVSCNVPNASASCAAGRCVIGMCNMGFANCDGLAGNGCEAKVDADIKSCGACGRVCAAANGSPGCVAGACTIAACNPGFADCNQLANDGCEAAVAMDVSNCGGCGKACPQPANATATCVNGACGVGMCKFGFADCDKDPKTGCEADLLSVKSCGACGVACPIPPHAMPACKGGVCGVGMCDALFGDCNGQAGDGCEKGLANDLNSCGACGKVCTAANGTPACLNGICGVVACNPGFADCNMNAADGCEADTANDPKSCGACGKVCGAQTPICASGVCTAACAGAVGGAIAAVMPTPMYGFCWYLGDGGRSCDTVCAAAGGTNQANNAINAFADDCAGGAPGQPATWFFLNSNACLWSGPAGVATNLKTLGHGYFDLFASRTFYGKCAAGAGAGTGTFPGGANNDGTRCVVCACSK